MPANHLLAILLAFCLAAASHADDRDFRRDVAPILQAYCVRCHGPERQEAKVRLDDLSTDVANDRAAAEQWHEVLHVLNAAEMPPEDEKQLPTRERELLTNWVAATVERAIAAQRSTSGRVVLRRLNRVEYQHTMSDLLHLDMNYVRDLPPDAISTDGFTNDGRFLQMSAFQFESYLATARRAMERVIVTGDAPREFHYAFTKSKIDGWLGSAQRSNRLGRQQEFLAKMKTDYPEQGDFIVRVTLTADLKPNVGYPLLEVSVGYRPDTQILLREFDVVEITSTKEQTFEFRGRLEDFPLPVRGQGKYPGLVVRVRNVYSDGSPLPKKQGKKPVYPDEPHLPTLLVKEVEFHGPVYQQWPTARHREILFDSPLRTVDQTAYVTAVLTRFMTRAYRRPVETHETQAMVDFFYEIRPAFPSFEEAMRETLALVLIRPDFLYLLEPAGDKKRPIGDWELATRLSYFLWSTMPDERLTELAAANKLQEPAVLAGEVDRMLQDARSSRFVEHFTDQWLHLGNLDSIAVDRKLFPGFDDRLKDEMRSETHAFFAELLRQNDNALNLLSSDFTMMNEALARHYGRTDIFGRQLRRVALEPNDHRGGLLGHAGILLSNSTGAESHPIRRAVWIRDRLLADPPAPPPPDVPSLEDSNPNFHELSIREQLEVHRNKEACARCHRNIDPWGIALENFNAVGLWRTEVSRKRGGKKQTVVIDAKDAFPNGVAIDGFDQLKSHLVNNHKDAFSRSLVSRLLTYALGRRLELSDQEAVDDIVSKFADNEHRLRDLVEMVVTSQPFMTK